jgi:MFS family permease
LGVLLLAPFLAQADATIANVATPAIRTDLGASAAAAELVIGGYLVAYAVLLVTGARLGQTHGYKRLFVIGVSGFGASSLIAGLAPSSVVLIVMRVLQGASAALMYPQALTGIQHNFSGDQRARAIGSFTIALAAGAVIGQLAGGVLVSADIAGSSWRPVFLVNVPICAV